MFLFTNSLWVIHLKIQPCQTKQGGILGAASVRPSYLPTVLAGMVVFFSAALIFIITIDELSLAGRVVWQGKKKEKVNGRGDEGRKGQVGEMLR